MARLLWLKTGPLYPADTGGRIRTLQMLRQLHRFHEIVYLSLLPRGTPEESLRFEDFASEAVWIDFDEAPSSGAGMAMSVLSSFFGSSLPYVIWKYRSQVMADRMVELHRQNPFDLVVCDYLFPSWNLLAARFPTRPPSVLFQHNVESRIWERRAKVARGPMQWFSHRQWQRLSRYEAETSRCFDGVISVSPEDSRLMREEYGLTNVLGDVGAGVDLNYFSPIAATLGQENFVAFLGSMDWKANSDGVLAFVREVWPSIRNRFPDIRFRIIGRNPPATIRDLAGRMPGIEVTGTVEDVRPYLRGAKALVVPLRIGGGTRIKIFESMAAGIPVVSTQIGAEGLPVRDGEELLLARDIADMAAPLSQLLSDSALAKEMACRATAFVRERCGWEAVAQDFDSLLSRVIGTRP